MKTNRNLFEKIVQISTGTAFAATMGNVNSAYYFMLCQPYIPAIPNQFQT